MEIVVNKKKLAIVKYRPLMNEIMYAYNANLDIKHIIKIELVLQANAHSILHA